jgi:hypothetical protein
MFSNFRGEKNLKEILNNRFKTALHNIIQRTVFVPWALIISQLDVRKVAQGNLDSSRTPNIRLHYIMRTHFDE